MNYPVKFIKGLVTLNDKTYCLFHPSPEDEKWAIRNELFKSEDGHYARIETDDTYYDGKDNDIYNITMIKIEGERLYRSVFEDCELGWDAPQSIQGLIWDSDVSI